MPIKTRGETLVGDWLFVWYKIITPTHSTRQLKWEKHNSTEARSGHHHLVPLKKDNPELRFTYEVLTSCVTYEVFFPKMVNLNLIKTLDLTSDLQKI